MSQMSRIGHGTSKCVPQNRFIAQSRDSAVDQTREETISRADRVDGGDGRRRHAIGCPPDSTARLVSVTTAQATPLRVQPL